MIFAMFITLTGLQAQAGLKVQKVDASEVPQAVLDAQAKYFSGIAVNLWEKQSGSVRERSGERFVANFQYEGQKARARYYPNGTAGTATSYYLTAKELPQVIQDAAAANYPGYQLNTGEKVTALTQAKTVFRLRLRKGAQKLVVYVDESGKELSKDSLPGEITAE